MPLASSSSVSQADFRLATYAPVVASPNTYASGCKKVSRGLHEDEISNRIDASLLFHGYQLFENRGCSESG